MSVTTAPARFRASFTVDATGCWLWTRALNSDGYGTFWSGARRAPREDGRRGTPVTVLAHRWSYQFFNGPIPDGHNVLHKCDTPGCVNPDHLFSGTQKDNVADCAAKGRRNQVRYRKLSAAIHDEIRERYRTEDVSQSQLAREFGVAQPTISHIVRAA